MNFKIVVYEMNATLIANGNSKKYIAVG